MDKWFDLKAEAFRICTGHTAPGKDSSQMSYQVSHQEREKAFAEWHSKNVVLIGAFGYAFRSVFGKGDARISLIQSALQEMLIHWDEADCTTPTECGVIEKARAALKEPT